jgi:hypothetical protein
VGELLSDSDSSDDLLDIISDAEDPPTDTTSCEALAAAALLPDPGLYTLPSQAPATLHAALSGPAARKWGAACKAEMDSLARMKTYELVPRTAVPRHRKILTPKWVFALKHDAQGNITKHKAHLVIHGFAQVPGLDFKETFSPILHLSLLHILLALAAYHD